MNSELASIETFLKTVPPLDRLDGERIAALARKISVRYFRAGQTILEAGSHNEHLFIIRSGAVELRLAGEDLTARMDLGGLFAYPSLLRGGEVRNTTLALEDTLAYSRHGYALRVDCRSCRRVAVLDPLQIVLQCQQRGWSKQMAALEGRLRCSRCGSRQTRLGPAFDQ